MSADPNDIIINAIRRKYGSAICDTLRDQSPLELNYHYKDTLTIPLVAEAKVFWEKEYPLHQLSCDVRTYFKDLGIAARQVFSAQSI